MRRRYISSPLNRDAAGFGDEDDDGSLVDDSSAVAAAFEEEDDIDEAAYPEICDWNKFPPPPDDPKWRSPYCSPRTLETTILTFFASKYFIFKFWTLQIFGNSVSSSALISQTTLDSPRS